jgi:hypothetical protein
MTGSAVKAHNLSQFTAPGTRESDVALFLPFGCNKGEHTTAKGGTKRMLKIGEFVE